MESRDAARSHRFEKAHGPNGCTAADEWFYSGPMMCWVCWWNECIVAPLARLGCLTRGRARLK